MKSQVQSATGITGLPPVKKTAGISKKPASTKDVKSSMCIKPATENNINCANSAKQMSAVVSKQAKVIKPKIKRD